MSKKSSWAEKAEVVVYPWLLLVAVWGQHQYPIKEKHEKHHRPVKRICRLYFQNWSNYQVALSLRTVISQVHQVFNIFNYFILCSLTCLCYAYIVLHCYIVTYCALVLHGMQYTVGATWLTKLISGKSWKMPCQGALKPRPAGRAAWRCEKTCGSWGLWHYMMSMSHYVSLCLTMSHWKASMKATRESKVTKCAWLAAVASSKACRMESSPKRLSLGTWA